jgi:eukaryotic translation initiation factor 2C
MVMGVDVSHGLTSSKKPSVAAVVGSQDTACICYCAAVLEQTAGHEVVLGMKEAAGHLLHGYCNQRGRLPEAILVFRDGVSDSMYAAVLQQEVADIRAACKSIAGPGCSPKVGY